MEEPGAQVATPIFIHQTLPSRFCEGRPMGKKRDLSYHHPSIYQHPQKQQLQRKGSHWNPKTWDWDSLGFVAKPKPLDVAELEKEKNKIDGNDERLLLKLNGGGGSGGGCSGHLNLADQKLVSRPSKKVRSGSPGDHTPTPTYPMCQVDDCKEDLSVAKDYHRRHKVCEFHSKSTEALVTDQLQRFCQQCSRFHPLPEYDEGKRSCRRRLAGHNKRRRKAQPEDVTSRLSHHGIQDNSASTKLDIVNLIRVLSSAQGNSGEEVIHCSSKLDSDKLVQILGKIKSLALPADFASKFPISGSDSQQILDKGLSEQQGRSNENTSSPTMELLPVFSVTPGTISQSSQSSDSEKTKAGCSDLATDLNLQDRSTLELRSIQNERSKSSYQHLVDHSGGRVQEVRVNLPLQLFSSSPENGNLPKLEASRKYCSSESSNPMEDRSPFSSPIAQNLFPMQTLTETSRHERTSINSNVGMSRSHGCDMSLRLFQEPNRGVDGSSFQKFPYQTGYTSSSGSDHSPSSLNSNCQDRTERIIFKLFDKDPSQIPGTVRAQIYKWLSHSPSEMESYIRPGCVILSIYASMPSAAWEQLEENFLWHVNSLLHDSDSDFWKSGRFLVHTGRQRASYKDGKLRLCKSWRMSKTPRLVCVSPLAVVGGQETALLLRGRNLTTPGTKIHCTYMGGYTSKDVSDIAYRGSTYDGVNLDSFNIQDTAPSVLGRCFIEVENGFQGNSFPIIIADPTICKELRLLESELIVEAEGCGSSGEKQSVDSGRRPGSREEVLHFLNELGWLFQRNRFSWRLDGPDYGLMRFKFVITFSVDRDWCVLVRTLLDMLVDKSLGGVGLARESLEALYEIHLLNRAVKRKCRNTVEMLLHYSASGDTFNKYIFPPNYPGPSGVTPLHLAACMSGSDDIIDLLTNDPQEIGLNGWNSLLDVNGLSPYACASMQNNQSYNALVARKLADRKKSQVYVPIGNDTVMVGQEQIPQFKPRTKCCARCAVRTINHSGRNLGSRGLLQRPYIHCMLAIAALCACVCVFFRALQCGIRLENIAHGTV